MGVLHLLWQGLPDIGAFLHLQWLYFLSWPIVVFVQGPAMISVVVPLLLILWAFRALPFPNALLPKIIPLAALCMIVSFATAYWGQTGLHFLSASEICWPLLVWMVGWRSFSPVWAYAFTFLIDFVVDVVEAGSHLHWSGYYWFGVGGAGLHDALFLSPLTAFCSAMLLAGLRELADKHHLLRRV